MALGEKKNSNILLGDNHGFGVIGSKFECPRKILYNHYVSDHSRRIVLMVQLFFQIVKTIRPRQALKNLSLFAPLVFSGNLLLANKLLVVIYAFACFTMMTSSIYLINDIIDLPLDRLHPFKKNRPIASGKLPIPIALFVAIVSATLSLALSASINYFFFLTVFAYFLLQIAYSLILKNIIVTDVLVVAAGFILRVYAGAIIINVHMNVWFLLCVVSLALFLSVGKRRAEMAIIDKGNLSRQRKTLSLYTPELLDAYLAMFSTSAWLSYALFTFFNSPPIIPYRIFSIIKFPLTLAGVNKWLMATVPLVIYGIMRYQVMVYRGSRAESPERILLSDKPLLAAIIIWGISVIAVIYGIQP